MTERPDYQERVSVVIPMYQAGPWIAETLASVDLQTYPIYECIVVDDGSTDDGPERVRTFAESARCDVRLISQPNAGVSAARNTGLAEATGDLLALLDADDLWHPTKIERQVHLMARSGASVSLTGYAQFDSSTRRILSVVSFRRPERALQRWLALEGSGLCLGSSGLIRRSALAKVQEFDPRVSICEDLEFTVRICRVGLLAIDRQVLVGYRSHDRQAHRQIDQVAENTAILFEEVLSFDEFSPAFGRRCRAGLDAHIGYGHLIRGDIGKAWVYLRSAARRDVVRLLTIPLNAVARRVSRRVRALLYQGAWLSVSSPWGPES